MDQMTCTLHYSNKSDSSQVKFSVDQIFTKEENHKGQHYEDERYEVYFYGVCYNEVELNKLNDSSKEQKQVAELVCQLFAKKNDAIFEKIRGKFNLVIWDKMTEAVYSVRDHFGIKPLYYYEDEDLFVCSSHKKQIQAIVRDDSLDIEGLQHYFSFQYVPAPHTLHETISNVPPASYVVKRPGQKAQLKRYWKPTFQPILQHEKSWIDQIQSLLANQVETYIKDEKDVGVFLSGGIDSTFIATLAKRAHPDLKTFSVGFSQEGFSEMDIAEETAELIDTEHYAKTITASEYIERLPEILWHMEDPLADPASIALFFVAEEARKEVQIALSGEGADEFFGGYNIYQEPDALKLFRYMPLPMKAAVNKLVRLFPDTLSGKSFFMRGTTPLEDRYIGNAKIFEEAQKEQFLKHYSKDIHYTQVTKRLYVEAKDLDPVATMQYIDINTWLHGDILLKADKIAHANQLDVRMPFTDKAVFDLASKLPVDLKIHNKTTKYILREAANGIIPNHVLHRRKLGFPIPIRHWLKNELHDWAKQLIHESEVDEYIDKQYVYQLLDVHCSGKADHSRKIWTCLIFMLWHQIFVERKYDFGQDIHVKSMIAADQE